MKFLINKPLLSASSQEGVSSSAGFTLLEVLIAMAILTMSLASIFSVESGSIRATERSKQLNIIAMLAKNAMVEAEFKIQGKKFEEIKEEESGKFDPPYQDYTWKMRVKELKFPSMANLSTTKSDGETANKSGNGANQQSEMISRVMTDYLSKSIREITITIVKSEGRKQPEFSISTYWVDLNHDLTLNN